MESEKKQICIKCINDTSVPGISFNLEGICRYCEEYEAIKHDITNYEYLQKLFLARIKKYKGMGEYDALIGISGGKDSTYVLYQLLNKYKLKVKTCTVDQGFLTKWAKERIDSIIKELGVDHEYINVDKEKLSQLYLLSIQITGAPCVTCSYIVYLNFMKFAFDQLIPMAIHGRSRPQMLKIYSRENCIDLFKPATDLALTPIEKVDLNKYYEETNIFGPLAPLIEGSFKEFQPDYTSNFKSEFISYFMYHPYDEKKMVKFLQENMNWQIPKDYNIFTHYDCAAHDAAGYLYEIADGRPFIMPELSTSIREGTINREEALQRLEKERFLEVPEIIFKNLCEYVGKSKDFLIRNAQRIAKKNLKRKNRAWH